MSLHMSYVVMVTVQYAQRYWIKNPNYIKTIKWNVHNQKVIHKSKSQNCEEKSYTPSYPHYPQWIM